MKAETARLIKVTSVTDFLQICQDTFYKEEYGRWVFRGQSKAGRKLIPSVGRVKHTSRDFQTFEKSLVDSFKRQAFHYANHAPNNEFEWLALGQHHGLPTRLLDWSRNPLVALYFSVSSNETHDGCVFALHAKSKLSDDGLVAHKPLEIGKPYKIVPRNITERMFAQEGLFTIQSAPQLPLEEQLRSDWKLERICVDASFKRSIRYDLFRLGMQEDKLFPSIEGLSKHLTWQHTVSPRRPR